MPNDATLGVPERPVTALHFTIEPPGGAAQRLAELDAEALRTVLARLRDLMAALSSVHGCTGFNLFVNDGRYGNQSVGELPEEDGRLRFHVLGRHGSETLAPTTILNAPEDFPLESISAEERTARLERLTRPAPEHPSPQTQTQTQTQTRAQTRANTSADGDEACTICDADGQELLRHGSARVIRPQRPLIPANVMLVPLRHVRHLSELSDQEFVDLFRIFDRVAGTFGQVHGCTSFNLFANDGQAAGQHVPHLHVHVFGRSEREETDPYQLLAGLRFNLRR